MKEFQSTMAMFVLFLSLSISAIEFTQDLVTINYTYDSGESDSIIIPKPWLKEFSPVFRTQWSGRFEDSNNEVEWQYSASSLLSIRDFLSGNLEAASIRLEDLAEYQKIIDFYQLDNDFTRLVLDITAEGWDNFDIESQEQIKNWLVELLNLRWSSAIEFMRDQAKDFTALFEYLWQEQRELFADLEIYNFNQQMLELANLSKEEIEYILKNYDCIEQALIQTLESRIMDHGLAMDMQTASQFTSFFISYYNLYISSARDAAWYAARNEARIAAVNAAVNAAWSAARIAAGYAARDEAGNAAGYAAWYAARNEARNEADNALDKLDLNDPQEIGRTSWKLANLFVLAYVAQPEYHETYFHLAYDAALNVLENDPNFNRSTDEVMDIIAERTWNKSDDLAQNPYIISLRNILEAVKPNDDATIIED